jgi:hypothetical protein
MPISLVTAQTVFSGRLREVVINLPAIILPFLSLPPAEVSDRFAPSRQTIGANQARHRRGYKEHGCLAIRRRAEPIDRERIHAHWPNQSCRKSRRYGDAQTGGLACGLRDGLLPALQGSVAALERPDVSVGLGIDAVISLASRRAVHLTGQYKFGLVPAQGRHLDEPAFGLLCRQLPEDLIRDVSVFRPDVTLVADFNVSDR